jgi:hypothetical protein
MNEPVAELDQRFSGPAAAPVSWDETRQVLEQAELSWIVTVRADGRPHLTPLVAVWSGEAPYFTTGADEQKAVNLRGNPHVILMTGRSGSSRPGTAPSRTRAAGPPWSSRSSPARRWRSPRAASARLATRSPSNLGQPRPEEDRWTRCCLVLPRNGYRLAA